MRLAQWDILEFSRNPKHVSPNFPDGYWPKTPMPPNEKAWDESVAAFQRDLQDMVRLVQNPRTNLFVKIRHGQGQSILREALVLADHNSYHLGQLVDLAPRSRRLAGERNAWRIADGGSRLQVSGLKVGCCSRVVDGESCRRVEAP